MRLFLALCSVYTQTSDSASESIYTNEWKQKYACCGLLSLLSFAFEFCTVHGLVVLQMLLLPLADGISIAGDDFVHPGKRLREEHGALKEAHVPAMLCQHKHHILFLFYGEQKWFKMYYINTVGIQATWSSHMIKPHDLGSSYLFLAKTRIAWSVTAINIQDGSRWMWLQSHKAGGMRDESCTMTVQWIFPSPRTQFAPSRAVGLKSCTLEKRYSGVFLEGTNINLLLNN